jgi:hypothetical protein
MCRAKKRPNKSCIGRKRCVTTASHVSHRWFLLFFFVLLLFLCFFSFQLRKLQVDALRKASSIDDVARRAADAAREFENQELIRQNAADMYDCAL